MLLSTRIPCVEASLNIGEIMGLYVLERLFVLVSSCLFGILCFHVFLIHFSGMSINQDRSTQYADRRNWVTGSFSTSTRLDSTFDGFSFLSSFFVVVINLYKKNLKAYLTIQKTFL